MSRSISTWTCSTRGNSVRCCSTNPAPPEDALAEVPRGRVAPDQVVRLLRDVAAACDVVGLAIAEYLPWEAVMTRNLLRQLPLLAEADRPEQK